MRRQAFTLVEMLVAVALITLIMAIVSQAFVDGLETFRQLRAVGELQEELRTAGVRLRNDLLTPHFQGGRYQLHNLTTRPTQGFFRIQQPLFLSPLNPQIQVSSFPEGQDSNGVWSYSGQTPPGFPPGAPASLNGAILHFTVAIPTGYKYPGNYYRALVPVPPDPASRLSLQPSLPPDYQQSGIMISQWAEVVWFLSPLRDPPGTGPQVMATAPNGGGTPTPLWALYRRQRLIVNDIQVATPLDQAGAASPPRVPTNELVTSLPEVCCKADVANPQFLYFPQPSELAVPGATILQTPGRRRAFMNPTGTFSNPTPMGTGFEYLRALTDLNNDLVLSNVISFEVKVLCQGEYQFKDFVDVLRDWRPGVPITPIPSNPPTIAYDTATTPLPPTTTPTTTPPPVIPYLIKAIQITVRIWDPKTEQTRQVTTVQDL